MNAILRGADPATVDLPGGLSAQGARDYIARTSPRWPGARSIATSSPTAG
jgi:hypothetical protein